MAIKVGINGFGRIGRMVFRAAIKDFTDIEVVAINDLGPVETNAHLFRFDSVHGRWREQFAVDDETAITIGDRRIGFSAAAEPGQTHAPAGRLALPAPAAPPAGGSMLFLGRRHEGSRRRPRAAGRGSPAR